jgi:hypothetical protein
VSESGHMGVVRGTSLLPSKAVAWLAVAPAVLSRAALRFPHAGGRSWRTCCGAARRCRRRACQRCGVASDCLAWLTCHVPGWQHAPHACARPRPPQVWLDEWTAVTGSPSPSAASSSSISGWGLSQASTSGRGSGGNGHSSSGGRGSMLGEMPADALDAVVASLEVRYKAIAIRSWWAIDSKAESLVYPAARCCALPANVAVLRREVRPAAPASPRCLRRLTPAGAARAAGLEPQ